MFIKFAKYLLLFFGLFALVLTCNTIPSRYLPPAAQPSIQNTATIPNLWLLRTPRVSIMGMPIGQQDLPLDQAHTQTAKATNLIRYYKHIHLIVDDSLIWADTIAQHRFFTNGNLLPLARPLPNNQYEFLLGIADAKAQFILQLISQEQQQINGQVQHQIIKRDTLPLFLGNHIDIDNDSQAEFIGYRYAPAVFCSTCDSVKYNPLLVYEMTDSGFLLDTTATKHWIQHHLAEFKGFKPDSSQWVHVAAGAEQPMQ